MICPKCGQTEYPKICPATITAVTHNGKLLMARHTKSPARGYGLIAGFCEIGETFEENVKRETMEEVGIKVILTDEAYTSGTSFLDMLISMDSVNPEQMLIDRENANAIQEKMNKVLSKMEKEVMGYYLEGMNYRQISRIMNKQPKAIDNALQRIKGKLASIGRDC